MRRSKCYKVSFFSSVFLLLLLLLLSFFFLHGLIDEFSAVKSLSG